jgi:putative acetyltransferase
MIRKFRENDLSAVMEIWLDTNICTHNFISKNYWLENYETVKTILPQAEIYVYEDDNTKQIIGFVGLSGDYIEGLFIRTDMQEKGFGKHLLDYVKENKIDLKLSVYQQNVRAIHFYEREAFVIESEKIDVNTNEKEFLMAWST